MEEPLDPEAAQAYIRAILDGPGMTVFTKRVKEESLEDAMTSLDVVNVLRGGKISKLTATPDGWRYQATTQRMTVQFSFRGRGHGASARPTELVIENARRNR